MRQILVKSAIALVLGIAPGLSLAQTEMPKKKPPEQSEGQGGGQYGNGGTKEQGTEGGQKMDQNGGQPMEKPSMKSEGTETKKPKAQPEDRNNEQGETTKKHSEEQGGSKGKRAVKGHVTEEQRGELRRVLRGAHVEPAPNINFSVGVGARIPREVHLYRLPPRIVPGYEGYEYFMLADDRIVIVDPETLEIVMVIG